MRPPALHPGPQDAIGDPSEARLTAIPGRATRRSVAPGAVVAEGEPAGGIRERLGIGELEGRQLRRATDVDEDAGRLVGPDDRRARRVVAERADVTVGVDGAIRR